MTDVPFADPTPRRRRDRDRAAGARGSTDSWAYLVGLGGHTADDQAQAAGASPADETVRPGPAEPLSRRAARLREASSDGDRAGAHLPTDGSPAASASVPLRPWWASPADRELDRQPDRQPGRQPDAPEPRRQPEPPADALAVSAPAEVPPAFRRSSPPPVPPDTRPEPSPVREQAQVNPWPGTVRPALPVPGAVRGRRASGRTSDLVPDVPAVREPGVAPSAPLASGEIELPRDARGHRGRGTSEAEVRLPQEASATAPRESAGAPVLGRPLLPPAALPGPVLPGVEPFVEPGQEPPARRSAPAGRAVQLPSASASSSGELDLRLVRDVAENRARRSWVSSSRRRLGAAPVRFPDLDPAGRPLAGDDVPGTPPSSRAAARAGGSRADTPGSAVLPSERARRRGSTTGRVPEVPAAPARGLLDPDSPTPPAGLLGPAMPGSWASEATGSGGAGLSPAGAGGATAGPDALDVVAGIRQAGRSSRRRTGADEPRSGTGEQSAAGRHGKEHPRSSWPPLRPVEGPAGDEATGRPRPPVLGNEVQDGDADPGHAAPEPSPSLERAPDVPVPGLRSRRAAGSRRSSGSTAAVSAVPAPAAGRAGRNLPAAIAVGLGLGAAVLVSLLWHKEAFVVVVAAAVLMALWELTGALAKKSIAVPIVPLAVGAVGMLVSAYVAGEDGLLVSFTLTAFGVLLWRIIDGTQGAARDVAAAVFVAAYVPFLAGFATLMLAPADGAYRVIVFIAVTVANDVGGYAAGVLFGRHPMAPSISPKKSWEGVAGSFALCMLVGAGTAYVLLHGSLVAGLAVGAAAAFTATLGDLSESLLKRDLGIKDMGTLLPGHGGMMDRLDSLLPTAPAVALLLALLVPVAGH